MSAERRLTSLKTTLVTDKVTTLLAVYIFLFINNNSRKNFIFFVFEDRLILIDVYITTVNAQYNLRTLIDR
jgi:hypothetical protein